MSLPVVLPRYIPKDLREQDRMFQHLNQGVRRNNYRTHAMDQRFLNQINGGGKRSTQSVNPLTATDAGGGLAEIQVAAHNLVFGFKTIPFGSGTITGLLNSTLYYVYTDDPDFLGGSAVYLATTNANIATQDDGRYYLGKITTPAGGGGGSSGGYGGGGGGGGNPLP